MNGVTNGRLNNNCNSTLVKHPIPAAEIRIQAPEEASCMTAFLKPLVELCFGISALVGVFSSWSKCHSAMMLNLG